MPKCGNCHESHPTVADIKACYAGEKPAAAAPKEPYWPASDRQINYALGLQEERLLPEDYKVKDASELRTMERDEVSGIINLLKTFSRKEGVKSERKQYTMPEGKYAVHDGRKWNFYQVDKPEKGRWAGYTFVKRLIGAPGQYRKENMLAIERTRILDLIEEDPNAAMTAYGLQSGRCGKCASPLTDPESLKRGIGPICLGKLGW